VVPDSVIPSTAQRDVIRSRAGAQALAPEDQTHVQLPNNDGTRLRKESCRGGACISGLDSFLNVGILVKVWGVLVQFLFLKKVLGKTQTAST